MLLKEILDRLELPPDDRIPGDAEVAAGDVTRWTIPDTTIRIERIEDGPRAGEFLFSADSVQRLHRLYRHAKHLPYQSVVEVGIYEEWVASDRTDVARQQLLRNRLQPVDASNPRATLEGFLDSVNRAYVLVENTQAALQTHPPEITLEEARELERRADNLLERAAFTLDLSGVAAALRADVGVESALQLKEVLDRLTLPPLDSVPNAQMVAAQRDRMAASSSAVGVPIRWRIPETEIEIAEVMKGERQGLFLFSAASVERIDGFYEEVHDLPYREGVRAIDYLSPDTSEGFYQAFISSPGGLVSGVHFLGKLLADMPAWLTEMRGGQTTWQWVGLLLCLLAVVVAAYAVIRIASHLAKRLRSPVDGWLMILAPIAIAIIVTGVANFVDNDLNVTGDLLAQVTSGASAIVVLMSVWVVFRLCTVIAETVIALPQIHEESIDATLLRLSASVIGFLLGAWMFVAGIHRLGVDVVPLLAGLGVGGLAVALAARPTIENVIGSFMIFADKP
ncbi:MAG: hypothetical protein ACR2QU_02415, partial [Gammaproteobacteria bacterium]